jgi:hypothetical protein
MSVALYVLIAIHKKSETAKRAALEGYYKEQTTLVSLPSRSITSDDQISKFNTFVPFCYDGLVETGVPNC